MSARYLLAISLSICLLSGSDRASAQTTPGATETLPPVTVTGTNPRGTAYRYDYGSGSTGLATSNFPLSSNTFTVTVPAYTVSDFILPIGPSGISGGGHPIQGVPFQPPATHS